MLRARRRDASLLARMETRMHGLDPSHAHRREALLASKAAEAEQRRQIPQITARFQEVYRPRFTQASKGQGEGESGESEKSQDTHFFPQTWQQLRPNPPPINSGILTRRRFGGRGKGETPP